MDYSEYLQIQNYKDYITERIQKIRKDEVIAYLDEFITLSLEAHIYDSRIRTIAILICDLFDISHEIGVFSIELNVKYKILARSERRQVYNHELSQISKTSATVKYRYLKVGAYVIGSGLLMSITSQLVATTAVTSIIALASTNSIMGILNSTVAVLSINASSFSGMVGFLGSSIAGVKMMNRTAPITNFRLNPLYNSSIDTNNNENDNPNDTDTDNIYAIPSYILISGHAEAGLSEKMIWGSDDDTTLLDESRDDQETSSTTDSTHNNPMSEPWVNVSPCGWFKEVITNGTPYLLNWIDSKDLETFTSNN